MNFVALLLTLLVGMFILLGSICGILFNNSKKFTDFSISIAFGVIVGLVIFELIPESFELLNGSIGVLRSIIAIVLLSLIGIIILKILDLFIPHHTHELHHNHNHNNDNCHNEHLYHIGIVSSITVIIHNFIEGASLYLISSANVVSGLMLCIGIGLHNFPMGLVISSTLSSAKHSKKRILVISLLLSISTFVGGIIMLVLGSISSNLEGILLSITIGMLVYISIFELLHQIYHMKNKKIPYIGISIGVILLLISILIEYILGI